VTFSGPETTRFAPSPTGLLHLGHAFAARIAHDFARSSGGRFLLRIEDIDQGRCRPAFEAAIRDDLAWLGLDWDGPVLRQSEHLARYRECVSGLAGRGLAYPCFCTRRTIAAEVERMGAAPHGAEGPLYPGTCRRLPEDQRRARIAAGEPYAWRLDVEACIDASGARPLAFEETGRGSGVEHGVIDVQPALFGDVVLARKDIGVSYHLAVVLDDAAQGVTLVTRGEDLFAATHVQRLLQAVLGITPPRYHHHALVRDAAGRRLAKRDRDQTLAALRAVGVTPAEIRSQLGDMPGRGFADLTRC
jgi:glutamyl-Q tRNA(Asp) synthetase